MIIKFRKISIFVWLVISIVSLPIQIFAQEESPSKPNDDRISNCFSGENRFGCTLRADNDPKKIENSQPASFSYIANSNKSDTVAVQAAFKLAFKDNSTTTDNLYSLKAQWHKNNAQDKEQDNVNLGASYGIRFGNYLQDYNRFRDLGFPDDYRPSYNDTFVDFGLSYNRKGIFGDATADACVADPSIKACGRQNLNTARAEVIIAPWHTSFSKTVGKEATGVFWQVAPTFKLFHDVALNSDIETLDGMKVDGSVTGMLGSVSLALSPDFVDNKWILTITGQHTESLSRSNTRTDDFDKSSPMLTVSLDYALGGSFIGDEGKNKFIPAIGITHTNGADPLNGKEDQKLQLLASR